MGQTAPTGELALGYIRVSTDDQDFERQRDEINIYGKRWGFTVARVFEDKQSGSDYDDRKGFQEMLKYLTENSQVKIVIFDEISRMGRDTVMQVTTYKELSLKGIRIFTRGKGEFGKTKEDNLLFTILSAIADYEKQTIIDRTSSGRRKVVRDGYTQISNRPYGYNLIPTQKKNRQVLKRQGIEIKQEEAPYAHKMYEIIDRSGTVYDVLRYLNENKVKPVKSEKWGKSSVLRILHSTTYYGKWQFGKWVKNHRTKYTLSKRLPEEIVTVDVPAIITKKLYDRVQVKLEDNRTKFNPKNQKATFVFKGQIKCACGGTMQTVFETRSKKRLYRCPQRNIEGVSTKSCPVKTIKADYLESILLKELKEKIGHVDFLKNQRMEKIGTMMEPVKALERSRNELKKEQVKNFIRLKSYLEKSVAMQSESPVKASMLDELAEELDQKIKGQITELEKLDIKIVEEREKGIDFDTFKDIQHALTYIKEKDLESFDSAIKRKIEFARGYIQDIRLDYRARETEALRKQVMALRKGIYRKENLRLRALYYTVANKEHEIRNTATQAIGIMVQFVNNYCQEMQMIYFHEKPDIVRNYHTGVKTKSVTTLVVHTTKDEEG